MFVGCLPALFFMSLLNNGLVIKQRKQQFLVHLSRGIRERSQDIPGHATGAEMRRAVGDWDADGCGQKAPYHQM